MDKTNQTDQEKKVLRIKIPKEAVYATGKRKSAIAKVWLFPGTGKISINNFEASCYLQRDRLVEEVTEALKVLDLDKKYDVVAKCLGGGISGQAQAIKLGVAKACVELNETFKKTLRLSSLLTRDSRIKERKKYGRRGARKRPQYRKR